MKEIPRPLLQPQEAQVCVCVRGEQQLTEVWRQGHNRPMTLPRHLLLDAAELRVVGGPGCGGRDSWEVGAGWGSTAVRAGVEVPTWKGTSFPRQWGLRYHQGQAGHWLHSHT